jgi:hypothetical protein
MSRAGRTLETLVAHLERVLLGNEGVTVQSPGYLRDKITKENREFDLLVTITKAHHVLHIAFEVKDWKRKVGSPPVEQFVTKTQDTDIQGKVFVSSSGYYKTALKKAAHHDIKCMTLQEAVSLQWCLLTNLPCHTWRVRHTRIRAMPQDHDAVVKERTSLGISSSAEGMAQTSLEILARDGHIVPWQRLRELAWKRICELRPIGPELNLKSTQQRREVIRFQTNAETALFVRWKGSAQQHAIQLVDVAVDYEIDVQDNPLSFHIYGCENGVAVAEVAQSGTFHAFGRDRKVSLVKDTENGIHVVVTNAQEKDLV